MGILVFHFIARLYIAILYTVDLTNHWIEENTGALFFLRFLSLLLSHFLSFSFNFLTSQTPSEDDNSEDERLEPLAP